MALGHLAAWPRDVEWKVPAADDDRRHRWRVWLDDWVPALAFDLLADYGVPVVRPATAHDIDVALAAAAAIGYPVVLKTVAHQHKSEVAGVCLDLADDVALRAAYLDLASRLGPAVSVQPMVPDGVEVSVGVVRDATFGPLVVVAAGGVRVELLGDRALSCPPVSHSGALRMLDGLRMRPLLDGWRGAEGVDVSALAEVIVGFSQLATELGDVIEAIEANPVIASPSGAVAVDALVIPRTQKIE